MRDIFIIVRWRAKVVFLLLVLVQEYKPCWRLLILYLLITEGPSFSKIIIDFIVEQQLIATSIFILLQHQL